MLWSTYLIRKLTSVTSFPQGQETFFDAGGAPIDRKYGLSMEIDFSAHATPKISSNNVEAETLIMRCERVQGRCRVPMQGSTQIWNAPPPIQLNREGDQYLECGLNQALEARENERN